MCRNCSWAEEEPRATASDDDKWVEKDWNVDGVIEIEKKWLDQAKTLIRKLMITEVSESYKIVQILEVEMERQPYDKDVVNIVVVALRETKEEREAMAALIKTEEEACGWCAHHADNHDYGAGDPLDVPCTECPDGSCHRQSTAPKTTGVRKGQRKKLVNA